jgi:hypothetical protein
MFAIIQKMRASMDLCFAQGGKRATASLHQKQFQ